MVAHARYLYLNREGRWADFQLVGLDRADDGSVCLSRLPALVVTPPPDADLFPKGPGGLAVGPDDSVYWTDGVQPFVFRIDGCTGKESCAPCMGGDGSAPTQFRQPRGLLFEPIRGALLVADSGNHRVQLFDAASFQFRGLWHLPAPLALAGDAEGNVYIATASGGQVLKVDVTGEITPFPPGPPPLQQPVGVSVGETEGQTRVYVLDADAKEVWVFDTAGEPVGSFPLGDEVEPLGLAVSADAVYVGDNHGRKVRKYRLDGKFVGEALYDGPVAALAIDGKTLLVNAGTGPPRRLVLAAGHVRSGFLWGGPFANPSGRPEQWHWLRVRLEALPAGAHVQLFVCRTKPGKLPPVGDDAATPPWVREVSDLDAQDATHPAFDKWLRVSLDAPECLFRGAPEQVIWIGMALSGEGRSSPILRQMRLDFDHETLLQYVPALYQEDNSRFFTARFLTLFESLYEEGHRLIEELARYADPWAAPEVALPWLAGWLGLELPEAWSVPRKRTAVADAFAVAGRRGTPQGLRRALRDLLAIEAFIEEPLSAAAWWVLPDDKDTDGSRLGGSTMLAGSEPQGAVLGSTAVLDQSKLIEGGDFGAPVFDDVAHRFVVRVRRRPHDSPATWQAVRAVIEREKPAHTSYELCIIEPRMRVGYQARVGIDTVVAGPTLPAPLGDDPGLQLAGDEPGRIGMRSDVGKSMRLT